MTRKMMALAVAGLLSVSANEARAGVPGGSFDFGSFCGGNDLETCAAAQVSFVGNELTIDIVNLSGFMGTPENTVFVAVGINGLGVTGATGLEMKLVGGSWVDASSLGWELDSGNFNAGFSAEDFAKNPNSYPGIASTCASTLPGAQTPAWATPGCSDGSYDYLTGAVSFRLTFASNISDLSNVSVLLRGRNVGFGEDTEGSLVCDTATNCEPPTEMPEPGTMVLFGTGLAAMLGIVRRREESEDAENSEA